MKQNQSPKRKKKALIIVLVMVVVLAGLGLGVSYFFGSQAAAAMVMQNDGKDTTQASIDQLAEWGYDVKEYAKETFESTYHGTEFMVTAEDGVTVYGTYYNPESLTDSDLVILIHGAGGDRISMEPLAKMYLTNGYQVIAYDQRDSGQSTEELVTFGYLEQRDLKAVVEYAKTQTSGQIILHGQSMGAATAALYASTDHGNENIAAVILDSAYSSMEELFLSVWHEMEESKSIPDSYMTWCTNWYLSWNYHFDFHDVDIVKESPSNKVSTLVIESAKDILALPEQVEQIYAAIGATKKQLWIVNSAHIEGYVDHPQEYQEKVLTFIKSN
ncbi:MAG: alpha/beta hydrolase [Lachnospiraceae bacterium]|nr:alpha/beta hydrolase [Lachnospiraceae bacterium]